MINWKPNIHVGEAFNRLFSLQLSLSHYDSKLMSLIAFPQHLNSIKHVFALKARFRAMIWKAKQHKLLAEEHPSAALFFDFCWLVINFRMQFYFSAFSSIRFKLLSIKAQHRRIAIIEDRFPIETWFYFTFLTTKLWQMKAL